MRSTQLMLACVTVQALLAAAREELAAAERTCTAAKSHMNALNATRNAARVAKVRCMACKHFTQFKEATMSVEDTAVSCHVAAAVRSEPEVSTQAGRAKCMDSSCCHNKCLQRATDVHHHSVGSGAQAQSYAG